MAQQSRIRLTTRKDTCTPMFVASLFTIARTWKQPRCPLTDEWIKKLWHNGILLSHKKNTFESVPMRWTSLETIIQSELRKRDINIY